jgi:Leucine-rich repeat (LRR) protein
LTLQEEQLGPGTFPSIRSLNLSGLRIRNAGAVFAAGATPFGGLTELVLDDNQLTAAVLPALAGLSALAALKLNGNRLGEGGAAVGFATVPRTATPPPAPVAAAASAIAATESGCDVEEAAEVVDCTGAGGPTDPLPPPAALAPWQLPALQVLQLRANRLASLAPLQLAARAPALRRLDVADNELTRIEGLEGLGRLRELVVSRNKLR